MGAVVARYAHVAIITSDNPRGEDPFDIISEIADGFARASCETRQVEDREAAIFQAIEEARAGDIVLVAGKGHEDYQEIRGQKFPFQDKEVVTRGCRSLL